MFSKALILRSLGNCNELVLQHFEGNCDDYTPRLLWKIIGNQDVSKSVTCDGNVCIALSHGLEEEERRTIEWFYPPAPSLDGLHCVEEKRDVLLPEQRVHLPPALCAAKRLLNPENTKTPDVSSCYPLCRELLPASQVIEEMCLRTERTCTWVRIFVIFGVQV